jgi:hypothetical protein
VSTRSAGAESGGCDTGLVQGAAETTVFALTRLERRGDELVVEGAWSGVRGLRFLRPTLLVGDRPVLASLADKPWAPEAERWRASFPWDAPVPDVEDLVLVVAPSVSVRLDGTALRARPAAPPADARLADEREALRAERDALRAAVARLEATMAHATDDERRARVLAERDAERARQEAEEARREREAALRTRERLAREHQEAVAEARQRTEEVERVRAELGQALAAAPDDAPAGVRTVRRVPAPRTAGPQLSAFDVWAIRVAGSVAAGCFLALLVLLALALT